MLELSTFEQFKDAEVTLDQVVADARFHSLAYAIDEAVIVVSAANIVLFANPAADRLMEQSAGDLIGHPFITPLPRMKSGSTTLTLKSGRKINVAATVSATVWEGSVAHMATLKATANISEKGANAVETLLGAMRARFLSHLNHELRTPLNTVMLASEAMASEIFGPLGTAKSKKRYKDYAKDINSAGQRLLDLVTDLLDLSRADAGELKLDESLFDLSDLIQSLLEQTEKTKTGGITHAINTHAVQPILLRGDREKLGRAVQHLISNSLAFTPANGQLNISSHLGADGQVLIRIADTGRGFSADDLQNAFRPFPKLHNVDMTDPAAGAGVGLALVRRTIELHGGAVRIESLAGQGTTVTCMIPSERVVLDINARTHH